MALQIINRKFTDYQGRYLSFPFFQGLDTVIARYDFQVDFSIQLSITQSMVVSGNTMILTSGSWEDFGFFAGANVSGSYSNGSSHNIPSGATVDFIDGASMTLSLTSGSLHDGNYSIGNISCDETPEAIELYFNLVPNQNGATNEFSLIDGEVNRFQVFLNSLGVGAPAISMARLGNFSGGSEMNATISRLTDVSGKRRYSTLITFKNWTIKDSALFLATDCVKPWYKVVVFPEFQNPTVSISTVSTPSDANTGGFNEVGNGGIPDYTLTSVTWLNENDEVIPAMDYSQNSKVEIVIAGDFTADSKFNIGWYFNSIEDVDYKILPLSIERNLMWLTKTSPLVVGANTSLDSALRSDGSKVQFNTIQITQNGTSATITGVFEPNVAFTNLIESKQTNNRNYRLSVRVEDSKLSQNFIRPVWLNVDTNTLIKQIIPLGEYEIEDYSLVGHDGETRRYYFIEDDLRSEYSFKLPRNNDFSSLEIGVVSESATSVFVLESFVCNLSEFPILPDGSRPINKIIQRNFNLSPTNPHNTVEFIRDVSLDDIDSFGVRVIYSFLARWEYWLSQPNADLFFFPNQNKDWFNFQGNGWNLMARLKIETQNGTYVNGIKIDVKDYNDWNGTTILEYFKLDGTQITKPLIDEVCKLRATHTSLTNFETPNQGFGQITVEPFENASRWDISDRYNHGNVAGNPLIPLDGELKLDSNVTGATYISECLFDPTKLSNPSKISFTARFLWDEKTLQENRAKFTVEPVKLPKNDTPDDRGGTDNCVECMFDVHADLNSNDTYRNMVSSRWFIAETATFILKKCGELTAFQPTAQGFPNDTTAKFCTIPWKDVLALDGVGCYELSVESETAGVEFSQVLGKFNLNQFTWERAQDSVMIRSVFNDANLKQRINFTNANVVDCVLFDGDVEEFQPNTEINNLVHSNFQQNKVKRENRTTWKVNVHFSGYCVINQIVNVHLLGENQLFVTDYRKNAFDKTILDKPVILEETPQMTPYYTSENQGCTFTVSEKIVDSVTKYGSVLASGVVNASNLLLPNTIINNEDADLLVNGNEFITVSAGSTTDIPVLNTEDTAVGDIDGSTVVIADSLININEEQVAELPAETELNITVEVDGVETGEWDEATQTWNVGEVLAPALVTLDGEPFFTAHAGTTTDVTLKDENGNPVEPLGIDGTSIVVESLNVPGWIRPSEWLPMPNITSTDDEIVALWAVFEEPGANNFACFTIFSSNGFFEVDHGDGSGWLTFANGTSFHEYDYTNTNLHASSLPYKQAIIKIRATSGGVLNAFNFNVITVSDQQVQTRYNHNFLELKISMPSADSGTSMTLPQTGRRANLLEHIEILNIGNLTSFSGAFQNNRNLIKVTISADTSNVTNLSSAFRECSRLIYLPEMDTSNVTDMGAIARNCASLIEVPDYDTSSVTNFLSAFTDCRSLVKTPVFDLSSCIVLSGLFTDCHVLEKVTLINSTSSLTTVSGAFARCFSLQEVSHFYTASVLSFRDTFNGCLSLKNIPNFDLSSVTDISFIFINTIALRNIPNFNTVNQLTFPLGVNSFTQSTNIVWIDMKFRNSVSINFCALNREALVHIFNNLLDRTGLASANINISGNPGAISEANGGLTAAERAIATSKNWTITG